MDLFTEFDYTIINSISPNEKPSNKMILSQRDLNNIFDLGHFTILFN